MSKITDKLEELEKRVAGLKDWKKKYEDGERERKKLAEAGKAANELREALTQFLALPPATAVPGPSKTTINLEEKELVVNLAHQEVEVSMTTSTVIGKIMFCAVTELAKDGFAEADLAGALKERGWNIVHNTLAPTLGGLVRDGYLIKIEGTRPSRYRLPGKLKLNVG